MFGMPTEDDGNRGDMLLSERAVTVTEVRSDLDAVGPPRPASCSASARRTVTPSPPGPTRALAERLGTEPVVFPGHHGGFVGGGRKNPYAGKPGRVRRRLPPPPHRSLDEERLIPFGRVRQGEAVRPPCPWRRCRCPRSGPGASTGAGQVEVRRAGHGTRRRSARPRPPAAPRRATGRSSPGPPRALVALFLRDPRGQRLTERMLTAPPSFPMMYGAFGSGSLNPVRGHGAGASASRGPGRSTPRRRGWPCRRHVPPRRP